MTTIQRTADEELDRLQRAADRGVLFNPDTASIPIKELRAERALVKQADIDENYLLKRIAERDAAISELVEAAEEHMEETNTSTVRLVKALAAYKAVQG